MTIGRATATREALWLLLFCVVVVAGAATGVNPPLALVDAQLGTVVRTANPLPNGTSGLRVAAGDLNHDGRDEFVIAPGFGGDSTVRVLGPDLVEHSSFRRWGDEPTNAD